MTQILKLAGLYQYEICGILSCAPGGEPAAMYECINVAAKPATTYKIGAEEQARIFRKMEENGEKFQAVYHSHPRTPPVPSGEDIRMAFYPDVAYVIVGLVSSREEHGDADGYGARAWSIVDGVVEEQPLIIIGTE
jgi:proteasome lid subunit RPN8/RPN11